MHRSTRARRRQQARDADTPTTRTPRLRSNGEPGERPRYHPGYYSAFVPDPDGNNIEVVNHDASW